MIPDFESDGLLPPGVHVATWDEFQERFAGSERREELIAALRFALLGLKAAGCTCAYVDGSFVSDKEAPGDVDVAWDPRNVDGTMLDPVLLNLRDRTGMRKKYRGDYFPSTFVEGRSLKTFVEFFQVDKATGNPKGIVKIDLESLA